jgi:hypothetical protein
VVSELLVVDSDLRPPEDDGGVWLGTNSLQTAMRLPDPVTLWVQLAHHDPDRNSTGGNRGSGRCPPTPDRGGLRGRIVVVPGA